MRTERFFWLVGSLLVVAVVVTHLLGVGPLGPQLWGANSYDFLPRAAVVAGCALLAAALAAAWRAPARLDRRLLAMAGAGGSRQGPGWLLGGVLGVLALALFWFLRARHTMLGDGNAFASSLPLGLPIQLREEPLTLLFQPWFYGLTRGLFRADAGNPADVARDTVALSSALAGVLFVPVAWALAREIAGQGALAGGGQDRGRRARVPLVFLLIVGQGCVQLFFGYVELYTIYALVLAAYLLASLRFLSGRSPLLLPAALLVLALALHFSALTLAPSFAVLVFSALTRRRARAGWLPALRDLGLGALLFALACLAFAGASPGYDMAGAIAGILRTLVTGLWQPGGDYPLVAWLHVSDFLNEQLLIGPVALAVFLAGATAAVALRAAAGPRALFALAAGGGYLAACWIAGDSNLGYARNWDLLAPAALVFCVAGLDLALRLPWSAVAQRRWLFVLSAVSLFHTVPWVALNASFDRSFARFETLPLRWGRTESTVGVWYLARGDTTQATDWFARSLDANPANNIAAYSLGRIFMNRAQYALAVEAFRAALGPRPSVEEYRLALVDALVREGGRPQAASAEAELDTLLAKNAHDARYWAADGVVLLGLGQRDGAMSAFVRARQLVPRRFDMDTLESRVDAPDGYRRALREEWPAIVAP